LAVWTVWEQEAAKQRELGIQKELDRRKQDALEAEARKQELKNSLR